MGLDASRRMSRGPLTDSVNCRGLVGRGSPVALGAWINTRSIARLVNVVALIPLSAHANLQCMCGLLQHRSSSYLIS